MSTVKVKLPDGKILEVLGETTTVLDVASTLSHGIKKNAIAGILNGELVDVETQIVSDSEVFIVTPDSPQGLHVIRHSAAHLLAHALKRIYGIDKVQLGVGPVVEHGFHYDADVPHPVSSEDLPKIEAVMREIAAENFLIQRRVVSRAEALRLFEEIGDELKMDLIQSFPKESLITIYQQGEFFDLCRGPHVPSTGWLKAFRLMSVGGAYWRGDARNKMLQRIHGIAFNKQAELDEHLYLLEEAKKRDHRKLAKELDLFMFSEDAPGMPFYLPNGLILRNEMEQFERTLQVRDYQEVRTPQMMHERFWQQSGHAEKYGDNMYFVDVEDERFALKPMSCPGHMEIYKNKPRSYRDLPLRFTEYGICHRHELSGTLSGLTRVRAFTQDDAHIFVRPEQIHAEIAGVMQLLDEIYRVFGFEYSIELSTRPDNALGSQTLWDEAEAALQDVLDRQEKSYQVNAGDGAFYGPKIDFHIKDALKRSWQCGTIQLDFQLPERMDLTYVGEDGQKHRPVVIHRAVYGSMERFIGILIEHYGGAFPVWLAPVQVRILPITIHQQDRAMELRRLLEERGIRVDVDDRHEKISHKIRDAQIRKIPYALVLGERELSDGTVSVRKYGIGDLGVIPIWDFVERVLDEIHRKLA